MKTKVIIRKLRRAAHKTPIIEEMFLLSDTANRLEMLSAELKKLHAKLATVTAKRDAAVKDLHDLSACSTCVNNGTKCHVGMPVAKSDVCCGGYEWRYQKLQPLPKWRVNELSEAREV